MRIILILGWVTWHLLPNSDKSHFFCQSFWSLSCHILFLLFLWLSAMFAMKTLQKYPIPNSFSVTKKSSYWCQPVFVVFWLLWCLVGLPVLSALLYLVKQKKWQYLGKISILRNFTHMYFSGEKEHPGTKFCSKNSIHGSLFFVISL